MPMGISLSTLGVPFQQNVIAQILGGAAFSAPLTHSLVLSRGTGSPTFTRASTATFTDWEGVLRTVPSGCARFEGGRMVRNLIGTTSRDFTNAAWDNLGTPTAVMDAVGPFGDANGACTITDAEAGQTSSKSQTITVTAGSKLVFSAFVRKESSKTSYAAISLRHNVAATKISVAIVDQVAGTVFGIVTDGGVIETPVATSIEDYNADYWRVSVTGIQAGATLTTIVSVHPAYSTNGTTFSAAALGTAVFADAQLEDVTGQADQTASEYVSVGATPINLCLQSNAFTTTWGAYLTPTPTQNVVGPDGALSAWTITDDTGGDNENINQSITLTAAAYTFSMFVKKTDGAQTGYPVSYVNTGTTFALMTLDTTDGVATNWTAYTGGTLLASQSVRCSSYNDDYWRFELTFTGTVAAYTFALFPAGTTSATYAGPAFQAAAVASHIFYGAQLELGSTATTYIPTTTVAKAYNEYHGAGVDGVEFFNTDRDGAVIPAATNTGYLAEGARTNLCLQSNAFTTTWTSNGAPSIVQNATGPDGATSAWTVTDSNAGLAEYLVQNMSLTAATYSFSLHAGKTVGATTFPMVFVGASPTGAVMTLDTNNGVATVWTQYDGGWTIVTSSASCVSVNDDFWRFTLTFLATAASWSILFWPAGTSNATQSTGAFTPSLTGSAVFYGAQVELGSSASTYIPTTTAAVPREADVLTYQTAGNIANAAGWCYAEFNYNWNGVRNMIVSTSTGFSTGAPLYIGQVAGTLYAVDSANQILSNPALNITSGAAGLAKVVSSWGGSSMAFAADGSYSPGSLAYSGTIIGSVIHIGGREPTEALFGTIRNVRIAQRQLSASEMQAITA